MDRARGTARETFRFRRVIARCCTTRIPASFRAERKKNDAAKSPYSSRWELEFKLESSSLRTGPRAKCPADLPDKRSEHEDALEFTFHRSGRKGRLKKGSLAELGETCCWTKAKRRRVAEDSKIRWRETHVEETSCLLPARSCQSSLSKMALICEFSPLEFSFELALLTTLKYTSLSTRARVHARAARSVLSFGTAR